ncbi:MAG: hypothetical protein AAF236_02760 [Verrucomicrobiota bacterium]
MKKTPRPELALAIGAVLFLTFLTGCGGGGKVPGLKQTEGKKPPSAARQAYGEVFAQRILPYKGSLYTVIVTTIDDNASVFQESMNSALQGNIDFSHLEQQMKPQSLFNMQLVELKGCFLESTAIELQEADRLNEISWKGNIMLRAKAQRRRSLDLSEAFNQLVGGAEEIPLSWVEHPLSWRVSPSVRATIDATAQTTDEQVSALNFFALISNQIADEFAEGMQETEWGDWSTAEEASFQTTYLEVGDKEVYAETMESLEGVIADGTSVGLFLPSGGGGGLLGMMSAMGVGESNTFLLKPNLEALKEAGLLD